MALYAVVLGLSILRFPLYKNTPLKLLPLIFLFTFITEYTGAFISNVLNVPNLAIYNIYYLFHFSFFLYVFMKMVDKRTFQRNIAVTIAIFVTVFVFDLLTTDVYKDSFVWTYLAGSLSLIYSIILYYIDVLQSPKVLVAKNDLLFWISVGLLLFYIGYLPIKILKAWFFSETNFFGLLMLIQFLLIVVMYLCFLIGFLWMKGKP